MSASSSHPATAVWQVHKTVDARPSCPHSRPVAHCSYFFISLPPGNLKICYSDHPFPQTKSMTSVGATRNVNQEISAPFSSGGFSNTFPRRRTKPPLLGGTYEGRFNASGRGFPHVATAGVDCTIVLEGKEGLASGTSCSSPIFASVVLLLNDRLIASRKPVLGFLSPILYSTGAGALNNITTGSNPGCHTNGFPAMAGWDPVCSSTCSVSVGSHCQGHLTV